MRWNGKWFSRSLLVLKLIFAICIIFFSFFTWCMIFFSFPFSLVIIWLIRSRLPEFKKKTINLTHIDNFISMLDTSKINMFPSHCVTISQRSICFYSSVYFRKLKMHEKLKQKGHILKQNIIKIKLWLKFTLKFMTFFCFSCQWHIYSVLFIYIFCFACGKIIIDCLYRLMHGKMNIRSYGFVCMCVCVRWYGRFALNQWSFGEVAGAVVKEMCLK